MSFSFQISATLIFSSHRLYHLRPFIGFFILSKMLYIPKILATLFFVSVTVQAQQGVSYVMSNDGTVQYPCETAALAETYYQDKCGSLSPSECVAKEGVLMSRHKDRRKRDDGRAEVAQGGSFDGLPHRPR